MQEVLDFINEIIRQEKGNRVHMESSLRDAELDSFGITVLFMELDDRYDYFKDVGDDEDPFTTIAYDTITISEMVDKCM